MTTNTYQKLAALKTMVLAAVLVSPIAFAQTAAKSGVAAMPVAASTSMPAGGTDMKTMMKESNDKMASMQMTGRPDIDFAMMMRMHHQGAIEMAQAELKDGKEPQMKKMARDIIAAQKREIAQFDKFLAKHAPSMEKMSK